MANEWYNQWAKAVDNIIGTIRLAALRPSRQHPSRRLLSTAKTAPTNPSSLVSLTNYTAVVIRCHIRTLWFLFVMAMTNKRLLLNERLPRRPFFRANCLQNS